MATYEQWKRSWGVKRQAALEQARLDNKTTDSDTIVSDRATENAKTMEKLIKTGKLTVETENSGGYKMFVSHFRASGEHLTVKKPPTLIPNPNRAFKNKKKGGISLGPTSVFFGEADRIAKSMGKKYNNLSKQYRESEEENDPLSEDDSLYDDIPDDDVDIM